MRETRHRTDKRPCTLLGTTLSALLLAGVGRAGDEKPLDASASDTRKANLRLSLVATSQESRPLNLLLTRAELQAIVRDYEFKTGEVLTAPIDDDDDVVVIGTRELAPLRDVSQNVKEGLAAPFWAVMHPKDAWRIFVPIPPKGGSQESERPAPDPR